MIRAVVFDMDGVIIDSEGVYLEYMLEFARKKNPGVKMEQLHPMVGKTSTDSWKVVAEAVNNGETWEEMRTEFRKRDIYAEVDYQRIYRPEVTEALEYLKVRDYKIGLASSTNLELILRVVGENGIRDYFDTIVSGGQFKQSKPHPEIYHYTAGRLGVPEAECLAVEDSTVGITAAVRAGMKVAALYDPRYGFDQSAADYHIKRVDEVPKLLESLSSSPAAGGAI